MKTESSNKKLADTIVHYLGYPPDVMVENDILRRIEHAVQEVEELSGFHYLYAHFTEPMPFMLANPAYMEHLSGADGYLLCATTLGAQVDRHLKRLQLTDMTNAVVFDAAASAYLEQRADEFERELPYEHMGFRFCPGYGGTSLEDSREIALRLRAERIGITFLDSGLMVPLKSMVGIVKIGGSENRKSCADCVVRQGCTFRAHGTKCYA